MDFDIVMNLIITLLEQGFMYAVLAMGVYITYSILDFPDLSVDGTLPLGAMVSSVLVLQGMNPWLAGLAAFLCGAGAGSVTGLLHVKLKIRPLLCGILVMTALISVNLVIVMAGTDGGSVAYFYNSPTIFNSGVMALIPEKIAGFRLRTLLLSLVLAAACKLLMDGYLKTKSGLLLRAAGSNEQYVVMLARDPGTSKILGLALGNGLAAFSGFIIAQSRGSADLQMGTGMVVMGLASVIIGMTLLSKVRFMKATTMVVLGSLIYKACLTAADALGMPSQYLKLLMAVLFTIALVTGGLFGRKGGKAHA